MSKNSSQMLKLLKINTENTQDGESIILSPEKLNKDLNFMSPKDNDRNAMLIRMKTSDETNQDYPYSYKTQQTGPEQMHNSYSNINTIGKTSVLY